MDLNKLTVKEARLRLDQGEISSLALTKACLSKIKELNSQLNACLTITEPLALAEASRADARLQAGERGGLLGIPYLCKDNIMTKGIKTTAASKILENYIAPYDASVIKRLKKSGAVLLGKTNLDEFAHGASTENSAFGPTKNPLDLSRVPGGSSGGSAAAVAADMCLFALGSDTGGSIRQPASFCGITGLKPSYGRVSRFGLIAMTSSTDVLGCLTKTVADAALVLQVIAGTDRQDATTIPNLVDDYTSFVGRGVKGLKIGWPKEYFSAAADPKITKKLEKLAKTLQEQGAEIVNVSLPYTKYTVPVYYIVAPSEISSNLARFDGIAWGASQPGDQDLQTFYRQNRGKGFGPEVKRRIMLGTYVLSAGYYDAYYQKAQLVRELIKKDFAQAFTKVDVLLTPTSPHVAFKIGEKVDDPLAMYLEDIYSSGASLSGLAAISVPAGLVAGLPIGAQIISPIAQEGKLFAVAKIIENDKN